MDKILNQEQRLRRKLRSKGFFLRKSRVKTPNIDNMGEYRITEKSSQGSVELVVAGQRFELTLEDVEEITMSM